jgi:hypothetical protein
MYGIRFSRTHVLRFPAHRASVPRSPTGVPPSATKPLCLRESATPGLHLKNQKPRRINRFHQRSRVQRASDARPPGHPKVKRQSLRFSSGRRHLGNLGAEQNLKREQIVEFIQALGARLQQPLLIIRDGFKALRSKLVPEYSDSLPGEFQIAVLPPYAPI